jgi:hypothetical protein
MIEDLSEGGPGVDGSERSVYALALAELLGPALGPRVVNRVRASCWTWIGRVPLREEQDGGSLVPKATPQYWAPVPGMAATRSNSEVPSPRLLAVLQSERPIRARQLASLAGRGGRQCSRTLFVVM